MEKKVRICESVGSQVMCRDPLLIPELLSGFASDDIWNIDETGLFWKALPDRGFGVKGSACKGGKKVKERFTANTTSKLQPPGSWYNPKFQSALPQLVFKACSYKD